MHGRGSFKSILAALLLLSSGVHAQNLAGVFPPGFGSEHESAQYRVAYDPDSDATAHRLHFQKSINDAFLWRVIGQARKSDAQQLDFDKFTAELFWNLSSGDSPWQQGIRFDAAVFTEGRPGSLAANWTGQYVGSERWRFRTNVLAAVQVGDGRQSGVFLQTRAEVLYRLSGGRNVGLHHYGVYGSSDDLRGIKEQGHQLGPFADVPLVGRWRLFGSALFGLTDGSPDMNLKLWITRSF
ncbi:MAG: hypothetical protein AAF004_06145 [Pseudomonadota bacterium]